MGAYPLLLKNFVSIHGTKIPMLKISKSNDLIFCKAEKLKRHSFNFLQAEKPQNKKCNFLGYKSSKNMN
eukprot:UN24010